MKEIKITEIENIRIGSAENKEAGTGCTVIICERGAAAGLDVRGGGPASRESELLKPMAAADVIQAVLLSGGSAFGILIIILLRALARRISHGLIRSRLKIPDHKIKQT